jgi:hypothetical protein
MEGIEVSFSEIFDFAADPEFPGGRKGLLVLRHFSPPPEQVHVRLITSSDDKRDACIGIQ